MKNRLKILGVVALILTSLVLAYHFLFALPKEQAVVECLRTYGEGWEQVITKETGATPRDFCTHGYDFTRFMALTRRSQEDARAQYPNPDDEILQQKIKQDTYLRMRQKIGVGY
ncbi:MAG: hypothetical protein V4436_03120 [Patescibacteria group bacterium]